MPMQDRIRMIRKALRLEPHPEGGYYRQVFKSARTVQPGDSRPERRALTAIYFLLIEGQCSRWHCVQSDEVWNHLEGGTLALSCYDAAADRLTQLKLGPYGPGVESVTAGSGRDMAGGQTPGGLCPCGLRCRTGFRVRRFSFSRRR